MPAQPAERPTGTATILFTDLVDSTAQRARLGEEAAEALRSTHDRLLVEAVTAHHGTVAKRVGDGIMATFRGAANAVAAGVAIQQAIDGHNRRAAVEPLAVRIGISLGDVTWEAEDCFGTPVIEAARLCAVAEGAQILVADIVRVSARGRGGHLFNSIGPVALKGLPEPVTTCAVAWEPIAAAGIPLPPRLGSRSPFAMFGRGAEAETFALAWAKAQDGQRQVVLLAGEPGIGKTRLATEAARVAHGDGGIVLFGGCDEDVGLPFRPFVEALRHYVTHAPDEVLAAHVQAHRGELARLVPELAKRIPNVPAPQVAEAETERFLLFEAVTGLLAAASRERPIVLVLDDLQWAGAPELLLLKHVVRSAEPLRLLVIGTYRDTDLSRTHPLTSVLADLRREGGVERVSLQGLDDAAVETLVAAVARHELDEALVALAHAVRRETEGNPFFIGEVIRHLSETGTLFQEAGRWTYRGDVAGLGIPEGVREVIGRRLGRLSETTSRMLGLAAVIGRQFDVALLAKVAETSEDAVLDALDEATAAALVSEVRGGSEQFTFRHALIRTTLYDELNAARRSRLHQRVGQALETLVHGRPESRIEELAYHWLAATRAADAGKAIGYTRQAGDRALANLAFEEAAAHYERALSVLAPHDRAGEDLRCDLLIALGVAQHRAGVGAHRETLAAAAGLARRLGDAARLGRAALAHARAGGTLSTSATVDEPLVALYEEAVAGIEGDSTVKAQLLAQLASELMYGSTLQRRDQLSRAAVEMARRLGDQPTLALTLSARAQAINDPSTMSERLRLAEELRTLAIGLGSLELQFFAAHHAAGPTLESGDVRGFEQQLRALDGLVPKLRQPYLAWIARYARATLAVLRGEPDAEQQAFAAYQVGTAANDPDAATVFGAHLAVLRWDQGRHDELAAAMQHFVETEPHNTTWRAGLAGTYGELDRLDEARAHFDILASQNFNIEQNWSWGSAAEMTLSGNACAHLRDLTAAAVLYRYLEPFAGQVAMVANTVSSYGSFAWPCGMLAAVLEMWDDAERHFKTALAMNDRIGARPWNVRTRRSYAEMLLDRNAPGDAARARDLIAAGRAEADTLGMAREVVRFQRLHERMEYD